MASSVHAFRYTRAQAAISNRARRQQVRSSQAGAVTAAVVFLPQAQVRDRLYLADIVAGVY